MADSCCESACGSAKTLNDPHWRRALWIALAVNAGMFGVEMVAGSAADSHALQADALDFLGDAANYAISLLVAGMAFSWRSRAALAKGVTLVAFGGWVLLTAVMAALGGASPEPATMGIVGFLALVTNAGVALMLYRFRTGDANMRSVWICSRNDAINNCLVIGAGFAVLATGSGLPDIFVALIMAGLGISGGLQVVRHARSEMRTAVA